MNGTLDRLARVSIWNIVSSQDRTHYRVALILMHCNSFLNQASVFIKKILLPTTQQRAVGPPTYHYESIGNPNALTHYQGASYPDRWLHVYCNCTNVCLYVYIINNN